MVLQLGKMGVVLPKYYPVDLDCVLYHAYWDGTARDHSSYGNDGIITGCTFVPNGVTFPNVGDLIDLTVDSSLQIGTGDFSCYAWVKTPYNASLQALVFYYDNVSSSMMYFFMYPYGDNIHEGVGGEVNIPMGVHYYDDIHIVGPYGPIDSNDWALVGYEIDRDVGNKMWWNDVVDPNSPTGDLYATAFPDFTFMRIGYADGAWYANRFGGIIGELYLFNSLLTDPQRTDLFNGTKSRYGL